MTPTPDNAERSIREHEAVIQAMTVDMIRLDGMRQEVEADRDRLAARVETLEGAISEDIEAEDEMYTLDREYDEAVECDYDPASQMAALDRAIAARHWSADARKALRALVAPDTPTSPTDTGDQA